MNYDKFGIPYTNTDELVTMLYKEPTLDLSRFFVTDPSEYNSHVNRLFLDFDKLKTYESFDDDLSVEEFDKKLQNNWHMPDKYKQFDIAQWLLEQCKTDVELQRVGQELLMYQDRDLFDLLRYMKYMVDTFRSKNIVWGLGRGSSVSSYVLYLIGVHKIDSIYYDLDIEEFLK
jgi:DNA polymerase III alpha subunit